MDLKALTPEEIKQAAPEDLAAASFEKMYDIFLRGLNGVGKKGLYRLLVAAVAGGLQEEPRFTDQKERALWVLVKNIDQCKYAMYTYALTSELQENKEGEKKDGE